MLKCVFRTEEFNGIRTFSGFEISGHAGYGTALGDNEGNDIVCAAVSSCTMLVCNALTENFGVNADVEVGENRIALRLNEHSETAAKLLSAFCEHLGIISEEHSKVKLTII